MCTTMIFVEEGVAFPTAKRLRPGVIQNYEGTNYKQDIFKINCVDEAQLGIGDSQG